MPSSEQLPSEPVASSTRLNEGVLFQNGAGRRCPVMTIRSVTSVRTVSTQGSA